MVRWGAGCYAQGRACRRRRRLRSPSFRYHYPPAARWLSYAAPNLIVLHDGRVESYGTTGDVGSPQTPTGRHESDQIVKQDVRTKEPVDLYTELMNLKELKDTSVITEEEFLIQKRRILEKR